MRHKVVFTSDLHGNDVKYRKLWMYANENHANSVIIGGDIAPNLDCKLTEEYILHQRRFLERDLPNLLSSLDCQIFLMMGNDDCRVNHDLLYEHELYKDIHCKRLKISEDFDIVGYGYVPITPFGIKDWEKYDLTDVPDKFEVEYTITKANNYYLEGKKSKRDGRKFFWEKNHFSHYDEILSSIQKDLQRHLFSQKSEKTLYIMHAPPHGNKLDKTNHGHVGSFAVTEFIEKVQPYMTLHGHIHQTVKLSGEYKQRFGKTLSVASGNDRLGRDLALIVFDLYNKKNIERIII